MARKVGQIVAVGEHKWMVRIFFGRNRDTGKRQHHNRTIYGPIKKAQAYLNKMLCERDLGRQTEGVKTPLNQYLDRWLGTAKMRLREKSYEDYTSLLERHVRPQLGEKLLGTISPLDIQNVCQQMIERGLSARTVHYTHAVLGSALRQAVKWHLLAQCPADGVQLPRLVKREMRVLSAEQARMFLKIALGTIYGPVFAVAMTTGMRPSEYLGLKWQDIDWDQGTVSVSRTLGRGTRGWRFAETKRAGSRRVIKLQNWIVRLLKELQERREKADAQDREWLEGAEMLFANEFGRPVSQNNLVFKHFKPILKQAGLPDIRLYDLRHTAATLALRAGVSPKVVAEQLGHASAAFTLDVYSHVLPHMQEEAAAKVEAVLLGNQAGGAAGAAFAP